METLACVFYSIMSKLQYEMFLKKYQNRTKYTGMDMSLLPTLWSTLESRYYQVLSLLHSYEKQGLSDLDISG